jgi:hypothetical protein
MSTLKEKEDLASRFRKHLITFFDTQKIFIKKEMALESRIWSFIKNILERIKIL